MVFPLPALPFELYYLTDDRPGYPAVFPVRLELDGVIDEAALARAIELCVARHPLLQARIETGKRGPQWVASARAIVLETREDFAKDPSLDPNERTLRAVLERREDGADLWLLFHHAAVDGLAGLWFGEEVLLAYEHLLHDRPGEPAWRTLDPERLAHRAEYGMAGYKMKFIDFINLLLIWWPLLFRRPAVLHSARSRPAEQDGSLLSYGTEWLSEEESAALVATAKQKKITLNDLLLRELYLAIDDWNANSPQARRPIRILIPQNLRLPGDEQMPAANVLGFTFIARTAAERRDHEQLLALNCKQTHDMREYRMSLYFNGGLAFSLAIPGLMRRMLHRRWPFATAVFTNLGPLYRNAPLPREGERLVAGSLTLRGVTGMAPLRPDTRLCLAIFTYARRLAICIRTDPHWFSSEEQDQFLRLYLDRVRRVLAEGTPVANAEHVSA